MEELVKKWINVSFIATKMVSIRVNVWIFSLILLETECSEACTQVQAGHGLQFSAEVAST